MEEIELKFLLDAHAERRLRSSGKLRRMTRGRASTSRLHTIYFDTPDWRLREAGIALRLRQEGGAWQQSVKAGRSLRGGFSRAREVESAVPGGKIDLDAIPDDDLKKAVRDALDGQSFEPRMETDIRRQRRILEHGGSLIEFALDCGEIRAGTRRETLREAELELIEGDPPALFDAAATIFDNGLVRFSERSKAARGYLLATEGRIEEPLAPRKAERVALAADMSTEDALQAILSECLEQIATNAAVIMYGEDSAGPHQLRVGLRRLRAGLRLLPKGHMPPRFEILSGEAQRLGRITGALRDADVMREDVLAPAACTLPGNGAAKLDQALAACAGEARARLRAELADARTQRFLLEVAGACGAGIRQRRAGDIGREQLGQPVTDTMHAALDRHWKRVQKRAKGIAGLSLDQRHELRKALKVLRYTVEFTKPLYGADRVGSFLKKLKRLQDVFGRLNDAVMAEHVLMGDDPPAARDPEARLAAGIIIGAARVRAEHEWEGAKKAWKALKKAGPFWEREAAKAA